MDFVISDFPRSLYIQYSWDINCLKGILREKFDRIGFIRKMEFHKILATEEKKISWRSKILPTIYPI